MLKIFIDRPVLSTVISILIVVLGILGLMSLPIEQYPNIAPPTVRVSANYSGANADVVMNSVVIPLEEQINGVEGMTYMTSTASNNGSASIVVYFEQDVDPDMATVNVQNLVNQASSQLPGEVTLSGVTVRKQQTDNVLRISCSSTNPEHDQQFIQNYVDINILPQIQRISGVGDASVMGARSYSMRIWLKPDVMASYGITPQEIQQLLSDQNVEAAPGTLGQNSDQTFQYPLRYTGRLKSAEEFGNIILRSSDGYILRLSEVADVELGSLNYSVLSTTDGRPAVSINVSQTANSNAHDLINRVKAELDEASKDFPPGFELTYMSDANEFLNASIQKVVSTLLEAFVLVFLVVLLFLQNFRTTLIPTIAIPVAIIGSFFVLQLLGFSVNLLTLFALVLAIGIVNDDAIVVVEAVHAQLEKGAKNAREASVQTMKEIAPAIVSITLVMAAIFIPVSFIGGTSGVFYKQFGLTLAAAIIISAINALTLSPSLSARFLRVGHGEQENPGGDEGKKKPTVKNLVKRFLDFFNSSFEKLTLQYEKTLRFLGKKKHRWITVAMIVTFSLVLFGMMRLIPTGFVPQEDSGEVILMITLPPGSSLERADTIVHQVADLSASIPEIGNVSTITGINFMSGIGSSYGTVMYKLVPWNDRKRSVSDIVTVLKERTDSIIGAQFMIFAAPTLRGFGLASGVDLKMQDRTGGDINDFYAVTQEFLRELQESDEILMASTTFNPNFPQKQIDVNVAKVMEAGLSMNDVLSTLQVYIGSLYTSNISLFGKSYRVILQASPEYRSKMDDLDSYYVKTASGEMSPITEFFTVTDVTGPQSISRYNLYTSMDVTIIPNSAEGYSTGNVINLVDRMSEKLPEGYTYEYSGMTREEVKSGSQTLMIFALSLIFVFLLLAALYESYILPFAVILSLPVGLAGVFIFLWLFGVHQGITNNIYVQISLIMLIGLLAKNAILIVEYAIQRRAQGMHIVEAAVTGAVARFRPILMTSFTFIVALIPLVLATGAGAVGNRSVGLSAVGGMLVGTVLGVLVIPSLYIIFQTLQDKFSSSGLVNTNEEKINKTKNDEKK